MTKNDLKELVNDVPPVPPAAETECGPASPKGRTNDNSNETLAKTKELKHFTSNLKSHQFSAKIKIYLNISF